MTDGAGVIGAGPARGRAVRAAVRAGLNAGWIELSHCFTMIEDAFEILPIPLISVVILLVVDAKHVHVPGTHFLIGSTLLAGMLILNVSVNGMAGMAMNLTAAREDGTLLRAKATPNGMLGLLIGEDRRHIRRHHAHRGRLPRPACWLPGRSPGWFLPRSCCAVWHAARPDRAWPPGGSGF